MNDQAWAWTVSAIEQPELLAEVAVNHWLYGSDDNSRFFVKVLQQKDLGEYYSPYETVNS